MNRDDRRVRIVLSIVGMAFVIASLVVTFRMESPSLGWGLLLVGMVMAVLLKWKR